MPPFLSSLTRLRRKRPLVLSLSTVLCFAIFTLVYQSSASLQALEIPFINVVDEQPAAPRLCRPDECNQGRWKPREPPFASIEELKVQYPTTHRGNWEICGSEETNREPEDQKRFHKHQSQRLVNLMNWVWEPEVGYVRDWDAEAFVLRMLKSPGGIIFSGGKCHFWPSCL